MSLFAMEGRKGLDVRKSLDDAMARADECDNVVIIMQKKEGGLLWYSPDNRTVAETVFIVQSFLFHLNCMAAGVKL